eukprot:4441496-Pleurochrysis_carterae.AAC.1
MRSLIRPGALLVQRDEALALRLPTPSTTPPTNSHETCPALNITLDPQKSIHRNLPPCQYPPLLMFDRWHRASARSADGNACDHHQHVRKRRETRKRVNRLLRVRVRVRESERERERAALQLQPRLHRRRPVGVSTECTGRASREHLRKMRKSTLVSVSEASASATNKAKQSRGRDGDRAALAVLYASALISVPVGPSRKRRLARAAERSRMHPRALRCCGAQVACSGA